MRKRQIALALVLASAPLSGCFIEPGEGTMLIFHGDIGLSDGEFEMEGYVSFDAGIPSKDVYRDVSLELYAANESLVYKEDLGDIHNGTQRVNTSVTHSPPPEYVIFDSPDFWDDDTATEYYVRSEEAYRGYQVKVATESSDLPITPSG